MWQAGRCLVQPRVDPSSAVESIYDLVLSISTCGYLLLEKVIQQEKERKAWGHQHRSLSHVSTKPTEFRNGGAYCCPVSEDLQQSSYSYMCCHLHIAGDKKINHCEKSRG